MNSYEKELKRKWDSIDYYDGGSLQLAVKHPLDWYVRYAAKDHKSIVIVCDAHADKILSSKSIETSCNLRKDGKFAISFTLVNEAQEDVFIAMASDIIEFSKNELNQKDSLGKVLKRYAAWLKLLDHKRSAILNFNAQKGLLAELVFLKESIEKGILLSDAVEGWVGPYGADQDFVYEDRWYEVKATGASSSQITISSIEQLDNSPDGEFVVWRVDKCASSQLGATTLYSMVHTLFDMMASNISVLDDFVLKLGAAGYIDVLEYDKQHFLISARQSYLVDESFPKIVRKDVPIEITNITYQLDLPSLKPWAK